MELTEDLYLGAGNHKIVYVDPRDRGRCIKLLHHAPDPDMEREFSYRRSLGSRADSMTLLTRYYGKVQTSRGEGYVFERVLDHDGTPSRTMLELLDEIALQPERVLEAQRMLMRFKRDFFSEEFLAAGMDPDNFLVQWVSPTESRVRIIDNIGCSASIPLAYHIRWVRKQRVKKYWRRFVEEEMRGHYGALLGERILEELGREESL